MNEKEFLQKFEMKLKFQGQSAGGGIDWDTEPRTVSVDFFLSHILPQVQVITVRNPWDLEQDANRRGELCGLLEIFTLPKKFDETWFEEGKNSTTRPPCGILFYGIGFPSEDPHGLIVEYSADVLYYRSVWMTYSKKEGIFSPSIPEEKVIQVIREAQEEEDRRVRCQNMSVDEIVTSMSREFTDGWLWVLGSYMQGILDQEEENITYLVPFFRGEDHPANSYPYQKVVDRLMYFAVSHYPGLFSPDFKWGRDRPPSLGPDFRSGGRNANRAQIRRLERVRQGELVLMDVLKMMIQDIKTIVQNREEAAKERLFFPEILVPDNLKAEPQLITLVFDDTDRPTPTESLHQFERSLDICPLPNKVRTISTDTLIDHILPQVVILNRPIGLDKTEHIRIVTMGKAEYKDLLEGKLRDTIVFWSRQDDEQTGQPRKLDSFSYYLSPLSDHICHMRSHDLGFRRPCEVEEVSKTIRLMQDELLVYQRRTDYYNQLHTETSIPIYCLRKFFTATTQFEDIKARATAQNKTLFGSVTAEEWPRVTKEIKAQAHDFLKYLHHNKKFDGLRILNTPYEDLNRREKNISWVLSEEFSDILQQLRTRKEEYLQGKGLQEKQLTVEDWEQIYHFPVKRLQELEKIRKERERRMKRKGEGPREVKFDLEITDEGGVLGNFHITRSKESQFSNYVHLWFEEDDQGKVYVGHLQNHTGHFKFEPRTKKITQHCGIEEDKHFRIVRLRK